MLFDLLGAAVVVFRTELIIFCGPDADLGLNCWVCKRMMLGRHFMFCGDSPLYVGGCAARRRGYTIGL